jgi:hypothetical protein
MNNDTALNASLKSEYPRSVAFFFPTAKIKKSDFEYYADEFKAELNVASIDSLQVFFVYYKQDLKSNTKGLKFINTLGRDTLFINYMKCLFIGFDSSLLIRAKNKMDYNFEVNKPRSLKSDDVFNVELEDTSVCIDLLKKIPVYADLIRESIDPNYSDSEKIQFLRDSVAELSEIVSILKVQIDSLNTQVKGLIDSNSNKTENSTDQNPTKKDKKNKSGDPITHPPIENKE